jgi:diguanylate cyclase (GGDEF)-like protein
VNQKARWLGRGLVVLGLAVVVFSILHAFHWALIGGVGGTLVGVGMLLSAAERGWRSESGVTGAPIADFDHLTDLVRRAHQARGSWIVGTREGDLTAGEEGLDDHERERGYALAQLAAVNERPHVSREGDGTYVAVGAFPYGAAVLLRGGKGGVDATDAVTEDLRRLVASLAQVESDWAQGDRVARQLAALTTSGQAIDTVAASAARLAEQIVGQGVVVAIQDSATGSLRVLGVSAAADPRLLGIVAPEWSPAGRAVTSGLYVVSGPGDDILGPRMPERRQRDRMGTAFPLKDGEAGIGALVVIGAPLNAGSPKAEQVNRLVAELGTRLSAVRAVHEAQERAVKDPLTGLHNRREFERRFDSYKHGNLSSPAALIYIDIDHFKRLNDSLGHPAGDAALVHVARILERETRGVDLVARIGGEEFAVWLPETTLAKAMDIAERMRRAIQNGDWKWDGQEERVTVSCGVASCPESTTSLENVRALADAALYRAKEAGRNRVEKATVSQ